MSWYTVAYTIVKAIAAIPGIISVLQEIVAGATAWYVSIQTNTSLKEIADAAALASKAKTKEERDHALDAWKSALSRNRFTN